jgi:hypothetical protein
MVDALAGALGSMPALVISVSSLPATLYITRPLRHQLIKLVFFERLIRDCGLDALLSRSQWNC